jgi:hypothetical protein
MSTKSAQDISVPSSPAEDARTDSPAEAVHALEADRVDSPPAAHSLDDHDAADGDVDVDHSEGVLRLEPVEEEDEGEGEEEVEDPAALAARLKLEDTIVKQVEYYFSDESLPYDSYLLEQMAKDPQGDRVHLNTICTFSKMKKLKTKPGAVAKVLGAKSQNLNVIGLGKNKGFLIQRKEPLPPAVIEGRRTVLVTAGIPPDSTEESVRALFEPFGEVVEVTFPPPKEAPSASASSAPTDPAAPATPDGDSPKEDSDDPKKGSSGRRGKAPSPVLEDPIACVRFAAEDQAQAAMTKLGNSGSWRQSLRMRLKIPSSGSLSKYKNGEGGTGRKRTTSIGEGDRQHADKKGDAAARARSGSNNWRSNETRARAPSGGQRDHQGSYDGEGILGTTPDELRGRTSSIGAAGRKKLVLAPPTHGVSPNNPVYKGIRPLRQPVGPDGTRGFARRNGGISLGPASAPIETSSSLLGSSPKSGMLYGSSPKTMSSFSPRTGGSYTSPKITGQSPSTRTPFSTSPRSYGSSPKQHRDNHRDGHRDSRDQHRDSHRDQRDHRDRDGSYHGPTRSPYLSSSPKTSSPLSSSPRAPSLASARSSAPISVPGGGAAT